MKKDTKLSLIKQKDFSLQQAKDTSQGILMRLGAAIMEHRYESLETIYSEYGSTKDADRRIICLCILGMMHIVNATPTTTKKIIIETAKRFKHYEALIKEDESIRKLDNKKYFAYSFDEIITTFIHKPLEMVLMKEVADKKQSLLALVSSGGIGRSYRFNLDANLPQLIATIGEVEKFFLLLGELPITDVDRRVIGLAYAFLDEGKYQILVEEKFFQPSSPTVSTTAIWHNYLFLRDEIFIFNPLLSQEVKDVCMRRHLTWSRIQRYITRKWIEEKKSWYLADLRRKFPKQKLLDVAVAVNALLINNTEATLEDIGICIEKGLSKSKTA